MLVFQWYIILYPLGSLFQLASLNDEFWKEKWKDLFGYEEGGKPKFPLSTPQPKTEAIRISLLCWQKRKSPPLKLKQKSNMTGIAKAVYDYEFGISAEKKPRYGHDEVTAYQLNPNPKSNELDLSKYKDDKEDERYNNLLEEEDDLEERYLKDALEDLQNAIRMRVTRYLRNAKRTLKKVCEGQFP